MHAQKPKCDVAPKPDSGTVKRIKPKTIAFLNYGLYPCVTGGIEIFHYYFIKAISEYYSCLVVTTCDSSLQNTHIQNLLIDLGRFKSQTIATIYYHCKYLVKYRSDISIIHIPYSSKSLFQYYHVMLFARLFRIPYVLRIHGGGMHPCRPKFMHALLFKKAAKIIAVSTPIKEEYERRLGKKIELIPSMLPFLKTDLSKSELREKYKINQDRLVMLYLGSIKKIKGPDVFVRAIMDMGLSYAKEKKLEVLFVGDGKLHEELSRYVESKSFDDVIRFIGRVPYERVHEFYELADIFVIPSLMEARPIALSEAQYHGLPAIGSNISTIANLIKERQNGFLFTPGDSSDLRRKLVLMIENNDLREKFADSCRNQSAGKMNFTQMVEEYVEMYGKIINGTSTAGYGYSEA